MCHGPGRSRRGANAIEFALTFPVFLVIISFTFDYGWYFFHKALISDALRQAVRIGSIQKQSIDEVNAGLGLCAACTTVARDAAVQRLGALGYTVTAADVTPAVSAIGGRCALTIAPTAAAIPHAPLMGLMPVPDGYNVRATSIAVYAAGCT